MVGEVGLGWGEKGLSKKEKTHGPGASVVTEGGHEMKEGKGGINDDGRRCDLGWRAHTTAYR